MKQVTINIVDEVNAVLQGLDPADFDALSERFSVFTTGYRHNPKYKLGIWDGKISFFKKNGRTYVKLLTEIIEYLRAHEYDINLVDNRSQLDLTVEPIQEDFLQKMGYEDVVLGEHQVRGINALLSEAGGIFEGGTGCGKTIMTAVLAHVYETKLNFKCIVIVPTSDLIDQTYHELNEFGIDVGCYGGNKKELNHFHLVSTWQSLQNNKGIIGNFDVVIVDECHGVKGQVLQELLNEHAAKAEIRIGLTGTLPQEDIDKMHVRVTLGDVVEKVEASELMSNGWLAKLKLFTYELVEDLRQDYHDFCEKYPDKASELSYKDFKKTYFPDYQSEKKFLQKRTERIEFLARLIETPKKNTLVLVPNIEFGRKISRHIENSIFFYGQDTKAIRNEIYKSFSERDDIVAITTFSLASTGLNIKRVFNLFLVDAGKSYVQVIQSIGRGLRKADDKDTIFVYDVYSDLKFSKRHNTQRRKHYRNKNYSFTSKKFDYLGWSQGEKQ